MEEQYWGGEWASREMRPFIITKGARVEGVEWALLGCCTLNFTLYRDIKVGLLPCLCRGRVELQDNLKTGI